MNNSSEPNKWVEVASVDLRGMVFLRISLAVFVVLYSLIEMYFPYPSEEIFLVDPSYLTTWRNPFFIGRAIAMIFAVPLAFGWHTQLSSILVWLGFLLHHQQLTSGSWALKFLLVFLFWSMFLPLGRLWSLDSKRKSALPVTTTNYSSLASFAMIAQLALIYLSAGATKNFQSWVIDHNALVKIFSNSGLASGVGQSLSSFSSVLAICSIMTIVLEAWGPIFLFYPKRNSLIRTVLCLSFIALHFGMLITMNLGFFPLVCASVWVAVLPTSVWNKICRTKQIDLPLSASMYQADVIRLPARLLIIALISYSALCAASHVGSTKGLVKASINYTLQWYGSRIGLDQQWTMYSA